MAKKNTVIKFETAKFALFIENKDGLHTHVRDGESFKGKQKACPLCANGGFFEKAMGKIGA